MLIKHQSFEISQSRNTQKCQRSDKLYEARKCPYLKFILIPGIIGFMLMCILVNVNFGSDVQKSRRNENTTVGLGDNVNLITNLTEFRKTAKESNAGSVSHEPPEATKGVKQNILVDHENRATSFKEFNIQEQSGLDTKEVLPTEVAKAYDEEAKVLPLDTTETKSSDLNVVSLKTKPTIEATYFKTQKLKWNEYGFPRILNFFPKTANHINKYDRPKLLNNNPEILSKEINSERQVTESTETIVHTAANANDGKIGNASRKLMYPIVDKELLADVDTVAEVGNEQDVPISLKTAKESLIKIGRESKFDLSKTVLSFGLVAEEKARLYDYQSPPQVDKTISAWDNTRVANSNHYKPHQEYENSARKQNNKLENSLTILQTSPNINEILHEVGNARKFHAWDNTRFANSNKYKPHQEYENSPGKRDDKLENSLKILQNSATINEISHEVGNDRKFQDNSPYAQKVKTDKPVTNNDLNIFETELKATTANLVGTAKNLNILPVTGIKDKLDVSTNGGEYKPHESETKFSLEENSNAKQLSREIGNDVRFRASKVISKGFNVTKWPRLILISYGVSKTSDGMANQDLSAGIVGTVNQPMQYHLSTVNTDIVGNTVPQYMPRTIALYNKNFENAIVRQKEENLSDSNPCEPKTSNVKDVPVGITHFSPQPTAIMDKVLKEPPNDQFSNSLTTSFETTQTVGSAVTELPTELKTKEAQLSGSKHYNPHEIKYFEKLIQISYDNNPEVGKALWQFRNHTNESIIQYPKAKNNITKPVSQVRDTEELAKPIEPWKWIKTQFGSITQIGHLPLHVNASHAIDLTVPKFLDQTQHRRTLREVDADIKLGINAIQCTPFTSNCSLICDTGGLSHIDIDLERLQDSCVNKDLTLELRNCVFEKGIMKSNLLYGFYSLQELQIINCNLTSIEDGVFKGTGVSKLQTLKFINNSITSLTATTFVGLTVLKHFELSQHVVGDNNLGSTFLTPMAPTLTNVKLVQTSDNNAIVDPSAWLLAPDFVALYIVDLANNNLRGVLTQKTFKSLAAVGTLNLQNCSLETIDIKPFELVLETLYYLYLNNNFLITLDPIFLDHLTDNQVVLSAKGNEWQCDCDHSAMIEYIKNENEYKNQYINIDDFLCKNPEDLKEINMVNVTLNCEAITTTISSPEPSDPTPSQNTETTEPTSKSTTEVAISPTTVTLDTTTPNSSTDTTTSSTTDSFDTTTPADTTTPTNLENVTCRSYDSTDLYAISVKPRTADLSIHPSSSTSITIITPIDLASYRITYFVKYTQYSTAQPTAAGECNITNLNEQQTYLFCLVPDTDDTVSPFDCLGHLMGNSVVNDWLLTSDKGWFLSVNIIAALLFCVIGGAIVYFVLCQRPCWLLTSSERVLPVHHSSHKIVLLPKRSSIIRRASSTSDETSHQTRTVSYLRPEPQCDRYSNAPSAVYASLHKPPTECAPTLPGIVNGHPCHSLHGGSHLHNATGRLRWSSYAEENDYGYNTIDHYEEVKF